MKITRSLAPIHPLDLAVTPCAVFADATWLEPDWVKVKRLRLSDGKPSHRFVHFTDLHHKGGRRICNRSSNSSTPNHRISSASPATSSIRPNTCREALELLEGIKSPMYGVPGNHDYWSHVSFDGMAKSFGGHGRRVVDG